MEETIPQENIDSCVVCHMIIQDTTKGIVKKYGDLEDTFLFCSDDCYKKYLENPDLYNLLQEEVVE